MGGKQLRSGKMPAGQLKKYTIVHEFIDNLPYLFMIVLGAAVFITGFKNNTQGMVIAGLYLFYSIAGTIWIMIFICPYCRGCFCGTRLFFSNNYISFIICG